MSRIGRKIIAIPSGVTVSVSGSHLSVKGPKGELNYELLPQVSLAIEGSAATVNRADDSKMARERHGLTRALVQNMVQGVSQGYEKRLEIIGVGYKAQVKGKVLQLNLGYSHPVDFAIPAGVTISQDEKNKNLLIIQGVDKQLVGQVASNIRGLKIPEPYKGKGIRYTDEVVRRKAGKAATGSKSA
jgi:large subunit ribosomal protein L6